MAGASGLGLGLSIPEVAGRVRATLDPAASALIARMSGAPGDARAALIDALVRALKASGVWAKLDLLYLLAAHDAQAARLNWVGSGFTLAAVNVPAFTIDRGYAGNGTTSYLDTGWDPATAPSPKYAQNNASLGMWSRTSAVKAAGAIGSTSVARAGLYPRNSDGKAYILANDPTFSAGTTVADGSGLFCSSRILASTRKLYRNAGLLATELVSSSAIPSGPFAILRFSTTYWSGEAAAAFAGSGLSDAEVAALHAALSAYLTAVGAAA